jgi:hypothetical protein
MMNETTFSHGANRKKILFISIEKNIFESFHQHDFILLHVTMYM